MVKIKGFCNICGNDVGNEGITHYDDVYCIPCWDIRQDEIKYEHDKYHDDRDEAFTIQERNPGFSRW